jgi:hypothetical protein
LIRIQVHMEQSTKPGGSTNGLFFLIAAIIVGAILMFLILRPGHG